jgi:hypothetical protein
MDTRSFPTSPPETRAEPVVAIFNSMDDIIDTLRLAFERAAFRPVTAKLSDWTAFACSSSTIGRKPGTSRASRSNGMEQR